MTYTPEQLRKMVADAYQTFKLAAQAPELARALADALEREAAKDAEIARLRKWQNIVSWLDNDEKTFFDWCAGGADPLGEFGRIGLRRETPDGEILYREYTAVGPWSRSALEAKP